MAGIHGPDLHSGKLSDALFQQIEIRRIWCHVRFPDIGKGIARYQVAVCRKDSDRPWGVPGDMYDPCVKTVFRKAGTVINEDIRLEGFKIIKYLLRYFFDCGRDKYPYEFIYRRAEMKILHNLFQGGMLNQRKVVRVHRGPDTIFLIK